MRGRAGVAWTLLAVMAAGCADLERAARSVDEAAASVLGAPEGEAEARYRQGLRYLNGEGVTADPARAVNEFRAAADEIPDAAFLLGLAYRSGRGVARDDPAAVGWFRSAGERGHAEAQFMMGLSSLRGLGTETDLAAARGWFDKAAAQNHAGAQYHLGLIYAAGLDVPRNDPLALSWLGKAAAQDHPEAQFALAEAHTNGRGTPVDHGWAARWYGKAAGQGVVRAQYMLGVSYATGLGLPQDFPQAARWLSLAAAKSDGDAVRLRDAIAARLTSEQRTAAATFAQNWRPSAPGPFADAPTIRFVQYALEQLGHDPGEVDGVWGAKTGRALAAFQKRAGIAASLTPELLQELKDKRLRRPD
jgi:TPR repeat protein